MLFSWSQARRLDYFALLAKSGPKGRICPGNLPLIKRVLCSLSYPGMVGLPFVA